jgi:hypothetical protein
MIGAWPRRFPPGPAPRLEAEDSPMTRKQVAKSFLDGITLAALAVAGLCLWSSVAGADPTSPLGGAICSGCSGTCPNSQIEANSVCSSSLKTCDANGSDCAGCGCDYHNNSTPPPQEGKKKCDCFVKQATWE